jgi:hypothetical protein
MIVESTNKVNSLEKDLMPFLERPECPNFALTADFPWVVDGKKQLTDMINANVAEPNELLERYQRFEYIINTDRGALVKDLFKGGEDGGKRSLEAIREKILHYEQAYYDIMTCSEDIVSFRVFGVVCKKLKQQLGDEANKTKERILEETYNWCVQTVERVTQDYENMQEAVEHDPQDEQDLVET